MESLFFLRYVKFMKLLSYIDKKSCESVGVFFGDAIGFQEGSGCIDTIHETIIHMLERGSKMFSCFLDVRKTKWHPREELAKKPN